MLAALLLAGAAAAQQPAFPLPQAAAQPAAPPAGESETQALLKVLKDDAARARLIARLQGEVQAAGPTGPQAAADAVAPPAAAQPLIGEQVIGKVPDLARSLGRTLRQDAYELRATVRRLGGLARIEAAELRKLAAELALPVLVSFAVAVAATLVALPFYRRAAGAALNGGLLRRTLTGMGGIVVDVSIVLAAAVAAGLAAGTLSPHVEGYLNAFVISGVLIVVVRAIFSPATPDMRPLPMGNATARSWTRHLGAVIILVAFGELFVAPIVAELASPITARATLVALYLLVILYMIALVMLRRQAPAEYFRARAAAAGDDVGLTLLAAVVPFWHVVAIAYLLFLAHQALTTSRAGLPLLVATARLAAAFAVGLLAVGLLNRLADRGVRLSDGFSRTFPTMEARLNAFAPDFLRLLRYVVLALWLGYALQAVGTVKLGDWIEARFGVDVVGAAASLVLIVLAGFFAWLVLAGWVDYRLAPHHGRTPTPREQTLLGLARNAGLVAILILGLTYGLSAIGLSVAPLLASAGVVGLAIGFGSQKLVQDIINGLFIQFENAINVGDVVEAGGKIGAVEKLTIRSVSLRDVEGVFHVVPFSSVDSVSNYMRGFSFHVADIAIAYGADIDAARREMIAAYDEMAADMAWGTKLVGGIEWFGVESLTDSAVVLRARLKTRPGEQWGVGRAYTELAKKRLDAAGIELAFRQMKLWFGDAGPDGAASGAADGAAQARRLLVARDRSMPGYVPREAGAPTDASDDHDGDGDR